MFSARLDVQRCHALVSLFIAPEFLPAEVITGVRVSGGGGDDCNLTMATKGTFVPAKKTKGKRREYLWRLAKGKVHVTVT